MVNLGTVSVFIRENEWAFQAEGVDAGGAATEYTMPSSVISDITDVTEDLSIYGVTVAVLTTVQKVVNTQLFNIYRADGSHFVQHDLSPFTAVANTTTPQSFYPLAFPVRVITGGNLARIWIQTATGAATACYLSMWGSFYTPQKLGSDIKPVSLEGIKWPIPRR